MPPRYRSMLASEDARARHVDDLDTRSPASSRKAKPRSMGDAARLSSGSRSVSVPVSAFTSEVLPWSMWPAVHKLRVARLAQG